MCIARLLLSCCYADAQLLACSAAVAAAANAVRNCQQRTVVTACALRESENEKARELFERQPFDHGPVQQRALLRLAMRGKDRSGTIRNVPTTFELEAERQALEHEQFAIDQGRWLQQL